jgi:hypothetical protein
VSSGEVGGSLARILRRTLSPFLLVLYSSQRPGQPHFKRKRVLYSRDEITLLELGYLGQLIMTNWDPRDIFSLTRNCEYVCYIIFRSCKCDRTTGDCFKKGTALNESYMVARNNSLPCGPGYKCIIIYLQVPYLYTRNKFWTYICVFLWVYGSLPMAPRCI